MQVSYNWLKDYIDLKLSPEKLAETLTMAGLTVDSVEKKGDCPILEIEVTANRPDWLSYIGVARELAALTGAKLRLPKFSTMKSHNTQYTIRNTIPVTVEDKKLCPRYTARIIRDVKVGESPAWLKSRLESVGLRPVNNIVDITNFCLFETGEPMHAFDLDKLDGNAIIVRKAHSGERIKTIDGISRLLEADMLVIADSSKPVAIAGVMGGTDTEVNLSTKNILLEAACFDPISVRRTSRRLALPTESSYRFERKVDITNIAASSDRASELIRSLAGGKTGEFIDIGSKKTASSAITLRIPRLDSILGVEIPLPKVKKILTALGMKIKSTSKNTLKLNTPSFRYDLKDEIDIIEEISRVYGYDKIPATIPAVVEQPELEPFELIVENKVRRVLVRLSLDEIITYSLLGRKLIENAAMDASAAVEIKNPLSNEQEMMRPSLAPGMLGAILWNINRRERDLKLFELGSAYFKDGNNFSEKKRLAIGICGEVSSWIGGSRRSGFFDLKGIFECLMSDLGVRSASLKQGMSDLFRPSTSAVIEIGGIKAGVIGEVNKKILANFDIKESVYFCEIHMDAVMPQVKLEKCFSPLPKYPSIYRDISIVVNSEVLNSDIVSLIKEKGRPILKDAVLIDRYAGKQIPDGKTGLTYRLDYRDPDKTLEEKEVSELHASILRALEEKFGARLR